MRAQALFQRPLCSSANFAAAIRLPFANKVAADECTDPHWWFPYANPRPSENPRYSSGDTSRDNAQASVLQHSRRRRSRNANRVGYSARMGLATKRR